MVSEYLSRSDVLSVQIHRRPSRSSTRYSIMDSDKKTGAASVALMGGNCNPSLQVPTNIRPFFTPLPVHHALILPYNHFVERLSGTTFVTRLDHRRSTLGANSITFLNLRLSIKNLSKESFIRCNSFCILSF